MKLRIIAYKGGIVMSITGYVFDRAKVTARADSSLYNFLALNRDTVIHGRGQGMSVTTTGLTCNINIGQAIIQGRLVEITAVEPVSIPANSTGYLCITVDLSQVNTSSGTPGNSDYTFVIGQLRTEFVETIVKDDLFNGGFIYNFSLGTVTSTDTDVTFTKDWNAYTPSAILPDGIVFGNSVTDYGSAIDDNRWYGSTGDLFIDVPNTKKLYVRNKDTEAVIATIPDDLFNNIFPDGIILGNSETDYGSAMSLNRWYGSTDNLIIDVPTTKNLTIRNKDTSEIIVTIPTNNVADFNKGINIDGTTTLTGTLHAQSTVNVDGQATFNNHVEANGTLNVDGNATYYGTSTFNDDVTLASTAPLTANGAATFNQTITSVNTDAASNTSLIYGDQWITSGTSSNLYVKVTYHNNLCVQNRDTGANDVQLKIGDNSTFIYGVKATQFIGPYDTGWTTFTLETIFQQTNVPVQFKCKGNIVTLSGRMDLTSSCTDGQIYTFATLPSNYRPSKVYYFTATTTYANTFFVGSINPNGRCDIHNLSGKTVPSGFGVHVWGVHTIVD
jgi:hypothetical protein